MSVSERLEDAKASASEKLDAARTQILEKSEAARAAAGEAIDSAKAGAGKVRATAADGIEANPVAAVIGGLVLGAVAGALLPRSDREAQLLRPVGSKLNEAALGAFAAAKEAGRQSLSEHGLSRDAAREQVGKLVDAATKTATAAGSAAAGSVRGG